MCRSCSEYRPSANSGYSVSLDDAVDAFKEKVNNKIRKQSHLHEFFITLKVKDARGRRYRGFEDVFGDFNTEYKYKRCVRAAERGGDEYMNLK